MKATDLRLGNAIYLYDSLHTVKLATLEKLITIPNNHHYKPVPLDEEWLIKFGFKFKAKDNILKAELKFDQDDFHYRTIEFFDLDDLIKFGEYLDMGVTLNYYDTQSEERDSYVHRESIAYVHQLQNLFFTLTGEELEIKQPL